MRWHVCTYTCILPHIKASQSPPARVMIATEDLKAMVSASRKLICDTQYHTATIMSTKPSRRKKKYTIIHPGKLCGPCCLCHKSQSTFRHLANMQEELLRYLLAIGHTDCVVVPLCQLKTSISTATAQVCTCTCMEG